MGTMHEVSRKGGACRRAAQETPMNPKPSLTLSVSASERVKYKILSTILSLLLWQSAAAADQGLMLHLAEQSGLLLVGIANCSDYPVLVNKRFGTAYEENGPGELFLEVRDANGVQYTLVADVSLAPLHEDHFYQLRPGEMIGRALVLENLTLDFGLRPGRYMVCAIYHSRVDNKNNAFHGKLISNKIFIQIRRER
jgi:hypothetical protein